MSPPVLVIEPGEVAFGSGVRRLPTPVDYQHDRRSDGRSDNQDQDGEHPQRR
jgi:hypothetical protein